MIKRFKSMARRFAPDNQALAPDRQANQTLAALRASRDSGPLTGETVFLPGLTLHADPTLRISGSYTSPTGRLLDITAHMAGDGNWCGLHIALPANDLTQYAMVGFAARFSAGHTQVARACLRSGVEDGFVDHFFDKHLLLRPQEASHLDALSVHHSQNVPLQAPWREVIVFLPTQDFQVSLIDLRIFVV